MTTKKLARMDNNLGTDVFSPANFLKYSCRNTCSIIPEYVNKKIYENGTQEQRRNAWKNVIITEQLRGVRYSTGMMQSLLRGTSKKYRAIYNAENTEDLPGTLIRVEGGRTRGGETVSEAYRYSGYMYDFLKRKFERNSINDNGLKLESTVHYGENYNNAFWNGTQMVYGDGDGQIFNHFTKSMDVVGHELTHGITQYEAALEYSNEPGALNESFSDVFGSLVKQYILKQTVDKADWLIGAELFTKKVRGRGPVVALRSMKEPGEAYDDPIIGKDPQRSHVKDLFTDSSDNGGVHINSGIPNKAFYLTAMEIGGRAWESAGKIWYITLRDRLREHSVFKDAARMTYEVAGTEFGLGSTEQRAVKNGWKGVGIIVT
jgi:Zn-dependent metalloprotease